MDLALNNLQRLICHKTQQTNQQQKKKKPYVIYKLLAPENTSFLELSHIYPVIYLIGKWQFFNTYANKTIVCIVSFREFFFLRLP